MRGRADASRRKSRCRGARRRCSCRSAQPRRQRRVVAFIDRPVVNAADPAVGRGQQVDGNRRVRHRTGSAPAQASNSPGLETRSEGAGATSGCAARNFASSSASSSRERNHRSSATPSCLSRSRQPRSTGISRRQGLHQVAHRLSHTQRPVGNALTGLRAGVAGGSTRRAPVPAANSRSHHASGGALAVRVALTAW